MGQFLWYSACSLTLKLVIYHYVLWPLYGHSLSLRSRNSRDTGLYISSGHMEYEEAACNKIPWVLIQHNPQEIHASHPNPHQRNSNPAPILDRSIPDKTQVSQVIKPGKPEVTRSPSPSPSSLNLKPTTNPCNHGHKTRINRSWPGWMRHAHWRYRSEDWESMQNIQLSSTNRRTGQMKSHWNTKDAYIDTLGLVEGVVKPILISDTEIRMPYISHGSLTDTWTQEKLLSAISSVWHGFKMLPRLSPEYTAAGYYSLFCVCTVGFVVLELAFVCVGWV